VGGLTTYEALPAGSIRGIERACGVTDESICSLRIAVKLIIYVAQGVTLKICLGSSAHLGPPPAHAYQQKAPVLKKLRWLVLKSVSDELQKPAKNKQASGNHPERMIEDGNHAKHQRDHNQRNAKAMAEPVDGMRMAARVLRDPLFAGASAWHARIINDA